MNYVKEREDFKEILENSVENVIKLLAEENNLVFQRKEREITEKIITNSIKNTDKETEKNNFIAELNSLESHIKSIYADNRVPLKYEIKLIQKVQNLKLQVLNI